MRDRNTEVAVQRKKVSDPTSLEYRRWLRSSRNFAKNIADTIQEVTHIIDMRERAQESNHPTSRKNVDTAVIHALLAAIQTHQKHTLSNEIEPEKHDQKLWNTLELYAHYLQ